MTPPDFPGSVLDRDLYLIVGKKEKGIIIFFISESNSGNEEMR